MIGTDIVMPDDALASRLPNEDAAENVMVPAFVSACSSTTAANVPAMTVITGLWNR